MNFKQVIQDYFTFSRNERKGITILLVIIFVLAIANKLVFYFETPAIIDTKLLKIPMEDTNRINDSVNVLVKQNKLFRFNPNLISRDALDSLSLPEGIKRNMLKYRERGGVYYSGNDFRKMYGVTDSIYKQLGPFLVFESDKVPIAQVKIQSELFTFDPNTTSDNDFVRLGLTEKQVQTIRNYQGKGGSFRTKADFLKIYSISQSQKDALVSYVVIEEKEKEIVEIKAERVEIQIEINGTDSIELMTLPGIGDKLSKRIVKYRDLLGGFYAFAQLKEVYGLSEQTIRQIEGMIKVDSTKIRKVDLNFADWNELARHPYIQKSLANKIIKFRTKYGSIAEPSILKDRMILNTEEYIRLKPYL